MIDEPVQLEQAWRQRSDAIPKGRRVETDVYLAAFTDAGHLTMATLDEGFRRFPRLSLEILS